MLSKTLCVHEITNLFITNGNCCCELRGRSHPKLGTIGRDEKPCHEVRTEEISLTEQDWQYAVQLLNAVNIRTNLAWLISGVWYCVTVIESKCLYQRNIKAFLKRS